MAGGDDIIVAPVAAGLVIGIALVVVFAAYSNSTTAASNGTGGDAAPPEPRDAAIPKNFRIVYSHGIGLDYTLTIDGNAVAVFTAQNCYSVTASRHATIVLSQEELATIWDAIDRNDFFSLGDLTEECPPLSMTCVGIEPEDNARLQITTGDNNKTNTVEFRQNYELNHNDTIELKKFKEIVSALDGVLSRYENLPMSDCAYL
ncbi:MAG TPA: hypothetical protein VJP79_06205 [Nitrososphaera sp.]|nr:hypothetical protein [Nitrososphaera sp.]